MTIDINELRKDKRPQSSITVHALLDRLKAAEKERDALRAAVRHEADCVEACKAEVDRLRAKIEQMEQQEPAAWVRKLGLDLPSVGCVTDLKYRPSDIPESSYIPLYLAPGAKGE